MQEADTSQEHSPFLAIADTYSPDSSPFSVVAQLPRVLQVLADGPDPLGGARHEDAAGQVALAQRQRARAMISMT